ncbi:MAG: major capsid protein [Arizlama microvirus]|nr:MAG: major capsid protein [Arizlama microvirus]
MKRNKFNLSHYKLLTMDQGPLVPCGLVEVLPGDTFQHSTSALIRVTPLMRPVMHPVHVRIHHWFVPHRLVWDDWEKFITGGADGFDASVFPTINFGANEPAVGTLGDYLGLPATAAGPTVSALPFRGYAKIWNEYYRDQDLQTLLALSTASGADSTTSTALQNVDWEKDYFTSSRPWTQKGPEVTIPLVGDAPVLGIGKASQVYGTAGQSVYESDGTTTTYPNSSKVNDASADNTWYIRGTAATGGVPDVFADLTGVSAANINDLRLAFALQRYEEARARYGSRYTEYLRYLGVRSSDARLQRPEYLGGGKQTIQFSEVLQTSPTTDGDDEVGVGNLKGHGIGAMRSNRYRKFFEEHGYVFSFISVKPRTMYVQGIPRTWARRTKEDFWQKELEHIGQQEVMRTEIYAETTDPDPVFGYQDRYDEYRRQESMVSGEFRTTAMDDWHMARKFASEPSLNASFVSANPTKRIYAEQTQHSLWVYAQHRLGVRRQLSRTGTSYIF